MIHPNSPLKKKNIHQNQYLQYPLHNTSPITKLQPINQASSNSIHHSQQFKHNQLSNKQLHTSQQKINPFAALSQLKSTQQQYEMLKKRMKVLKLKDEKNNNRYQLNQRKLILHTSIQRLAQMQKQKIRQWKQQTDERISQQRVVNLQQKLVHHKNIQQIVETIQQTRLREYEHRKQQSKYHQQKIKQIQLQSILNNKQKVQKIKQLQQMSRMNIETYNKHKLYEYRQKKFKQTGMLQNKKIQKQVQIKKMLQLQMQMLQKQSRSRIMFDKSSQKLKQVLNPQISIRNSRLQKSSLSLNKNINHNKNKNINNQTRQDSINIIPNVNNINHSLNNNNNNNNSNQLQNDKNTQSLTQSPSYKSQSMKNGFSLPEIKSARKHN